MSESSKSASSTGPAAVGKNKDASNIRDGSLQVRMKLLEKQREYHANRPSAENKQDIVVEGGGLKDRLQLLEEQRKREAEKILAQKQYHTDPAQIQNDLIRERLKWVEEQRKDSARTMAKAAIVVEGGGLRDRLALLEETRQREAARLVAKSTTNLAQVSDALIRERLKWMDEQAQESLSDGGGTSNTKAAVVVEGGNLQERLALLEEQRRRQAERAISYRTDLSRVSDDLIRERLQWMDEQSQKAKEGTQSSKEAIVVEGRNLHERKQLLEEQRRREAERVAVQRIIESSANTISDRLAWLSELKKGQIEIRRPDFMSSDLIIERMTWFKESAEKAAALPEKKRVEMTNTLVKQRKEWLDEQLQKAAQLPEKERIEVTHGLIAERMAWLQERMETSSNLSKDERIQMTTDLIAERIWTLSLHLQIADEEETKANLEMQINFLEEQKEIVADKTDDEQQQLASILITEKIEELEQQKELISDITEDQQIEVTQALLEDRQAWLEGDADYHARKLEEQKHQDAVQNEQMMEEQQTVQRIADEVARSINFWTEQKEAAASTSEEERIQIASFLMAEHVVSLEHQLEGATDDEMRENLLQQIEFLNDQMDSIEEVDHLMMIDMLVKEKIAALEKMVL